MNSYADTAFLQLYACAWLISWGGFNRGKTADSYAYLTSTLWPGTEQQCAISRPTESGIYPLQDPRKIRLSLWFGSSVWECLGKICFRTSRMLPLYTAVVDLVEIPLEPDYQVWISSTFPCRTTRSNLALCDSLPEVPEPDIKQGQPFCHVYFGHQWHLCSPHSKPYFLH